MRISERARRIEPFYVMEVAKAAAQLAREVARSDRPMIFLNIGEPDFTAPPLVREHRLYQADWLKHMKAASVAAVSAPQQPAAQPALSDEQVQEAMRLADEVASIAAAQYLPGYQQADEDQARAALETYLRGIGR